MEAAAIVSKPWTVKSSLRAIGLTPEIVREVAMAAASARAEALPIDPCSAPGTRSYLQGVRTVRLQLLPLGWRMSRAGNIESTVNDDLGVQICFQNVDNACSVIEPQAISGKGPAARTLIKNGQGDLFDEPRALTKSKFGKAPKVWLICVSANDDSVRAEVSCPDEFEGDQFAGFTQRIFVVDESFEPRLTRRKNEELDQDLDFDILVSKK